MNGTFSAEPIETPRIGPGTNVAAKSLPRVLYAVVLDPTQKFGSLEEQIICLSREFQVQGGYFCPLFICPEDKNECTAFQAVGIEAEYLDLRTFRWSQLARLSRIISQRGITLVHWNFTEMLRNSYLWWLTLLHPNVRHCYTDHISRVSGVRATSCGLKATLKRALLHRYDKVFCVSQFVLNDLRHQEIRSNLVLARHFINTNRFCPDPAARAELREKFEVENCFVVLTVAHLIKAKGVDTAIRALKELPDQIVLWIVGNGDELAGLKQLCSELHIASRVRFHGLQKNVAPFMQASDCFVCPSLWAEAAGLVNLEASATGLPVIASRIGGLPEYVQDGITGYLFSPGDYCELAWCVRTLAENMALRSKMSTQARAMAVERFSSAVGIPDYLESYRHVGYAVS